MKNHFTNILLIFSFLALNIGLYAQDLDVDDTQNLSCSEKLQEAVSKYDAGKIHEIPEDFGISRDGANNVRVGDCLVPGSLTKEELSSAFRLLTIVFLQLDEPAMAEQMLLRMFNANPEYRINEAIDPTEFVNLYKTYRTKPIIKIGAGGGTNMTYFRATENNSLTDVPRVLDPQFGVQFGIIAEFELSDIILKTSNKDRLLLTSEFFFTNYKMDYTYANNEIQFVHNFRDEYTYQNLNLSLLGNYNLMPIDKAGQTLRKFQIFATAGLNFSYLSAATARVTDGELQASGGENLEYLPLDINEAFDSFNLWAVAGTSIRYKVGLPWIFVNARYNFQILDNFIEEKKYIFQDYQNSTAGAAPAAGRKMAFSITGGVIIPIYKFKKKQID